MVVLVFLAPLFLIALGFRELLLRAPTVRLGLLGRMLAGCRRPPCGEKRDDDERDGDGHEDHNREHVPSLLAFRLTRLRDGSHTEMCEADRRAGRALERASARAGRAARARTPCPVLRGPARPR